MTRSCNSCKTPVRGHVLVINDRDYHRKSCYCSQQHGKAKGLCATCEPSAGKSSKAPDASGKRTREGRKPRSVMLVS